MKRIPTLAKQKSAINSLKNKPSIVKFVCIKLKNLQQELTIFWLSLNFAQRCYFTALFLLLTNLFSDDAAHNPFKTVVAIIAVVGLVTEFWPSFIRFWHSLPGKAVIVLFYAIVANFALANSAGIVNDITGVSAENVPYTHNLAVLLVMPSLFVINSLLVLILINALMPLYLFILLLLKPFGIHSLVSASPCRFPYTTGLIRYIFTLFFSFVFFSYAIDAGIVSKQLRGIADIIVNEVEKIEPQKNEKNVSFLNKEVLNTNVKELKSTSKDVSETKSQQNEGDIDFSINNGEIDSNVDSEIIRLRAEKYEYYMKYLLSIFIYEVEADSRSRCQHASTSRVIEINDYEILTVTADDAEPLGYRYQVEKCISPAFPEENASDKQTIPIGLMTSPLSHIKQ